MFPWQPRPMSPSDHPPDVSPGAATPSPEPSEPPVPPAFDTLPDVRRLKFVRWLYTSGRLTDTAEENAEEDA